MCRTSTSETLPLAGLWHQCQVTSSAGKIRNEGPCCHPCVLKLVPSILLLLGDAGCDYFFQERVTETSTRSWEQMKHKAAPAPMHIVQWHLQRDCYLWKKGSKPQGTENFIDCSMFYIIGKAVLTPALLEKSDFKRDWDQHIANAWVTLHWSCFGIYKLVVLRGMDGTGVSMERVWECRQRLIIWKQIPLTLKCPFHSYTFWDTSSLQLFKSKVYLMEKRVVTKSLRLFFFSLTGHQGV